jgi:hypothetical protein
MTDDDRLRQLLQSALPKTSDEGPSRDLWPLLASRIDRTHSWPWLDLSLAAAVAIVLLVFPEWLLLLLYHL